MCFLDNDLLDNNKSNNSCNQSKILNNKSEICKVCKKHSLSEKINSEKPKNYSNSIDSIKIRTFGGLYAKNFIPLELKANKTIQLALPLKTSSNNIILGENTITIIENGIYKITSFINLKSADENSFYVYFYTKKNGLKLDDLFHKLCVKDTFKEISMMTLLPLQSGDIIESALFSNTGGKISFDIGLSASLIIIKIS